MMRNILKCEEYEIGNSGPYHIIEEISDAKGYFSSANSSHYIGDENSGGLQTLRKK